MERQRSAGIASGVAEMHGWRLEMEDTYVCIHYEGRGGLFAICDGHAGRTCATFVAEVLRERAFQILDAMVETGDAGKVLGATFREIDLSFAEEHGTQDKSGCTCVTVLFLDRPDGHDIVVAHVGDSRAALGNVTECKLLERGGSEGALTTDHSPGRKDETLRIERAGGWVSEICGIHRIGGALAVSRAFGDMEYKTGGVTEAPLVNAVPEVCETHCSPQDFVVLFCDGANEGSLTSRDIARMAAISLKTTGDPAMAARAVCRAALQSGSKDNITCMVVCGASLGQEVLVSEELEEATCVFPHDQEYMHAYNSFGSRAGGGVVRPPRLPNPMENSVIINHMHATSRR